MKYTPLNDYIFLRPEPEKKSVVIVPEGSSGPRPFRGIVMAYGPDVKSKIKVGFTVLYKKFNNEDFEIDKEKLIVVKEEDVLGIIE